MEKLKYYKKYAIALFVFALVIFALLYFPNSDPEKIIKREYAAASATYYIQEKTKFLHGYAYITEGFDYGGGSGDYRLFYFERNLFGYGWWKFQLGLKVNKESGTDSYLSGCNGIIDDVRILFFVNQNPEMKDVRITVGQVESIATFRKKKLGTGLSSYTYMAFPQKMVGNYDLVYTMKNGKSIKLSTGILQEEE